MVQFRTWYEGASLAGVTEPDSMTLATATAEGRPSARTVLLRGFDRRGFVFYTNYESRKGRELAENPHAALAFYWPELDRQVRIEGRVERTTAAESDAYFAARPLGSRLSAIASPQSRRVSGRSELERRVEELVRRYRHAPERVSRPDYWGGFRLIPHVLEFWQCGPNRLHDRLRYRRGDDGVWVIERLAP